MKNDYSEVSSIITNVIRTRACHISRCWTKLRGVLFAFFVSSNIFGTGEKTRVTIPFLPLRLHACMHVRHCVRELSTPPTCPTASRNSSIMFSPLPSPSLRASTPADATSGSPPSSLTGTVSPSPGTDILTGRRARAVTLPLAVTGGGAGRD